MKINKQRNYLNTSRPHVEVQTNFVPLPCCLIFFLVWCIGYGLYSELRKDRKSNLMDWCNII